MLYRATKDIIDFLLTGPRWARIYTILPSLKWTSFRGAGHLQAR